jgi:hypothetical protein
MGINMKQLTIQLNEIFYKHIQQIAEERNVSMSAVIREKIEQSTVNEKKSSLSPVGLEKVMLGMTLQVLGLVRFLVAQINEETIREAMEKSDKVVEEFYDTSSKE